MARVVIADTGPIYYLVLIDCADILHTLFAAVIIPSTVLAELTHAETPAKVREWMGQSPEWLAVHDVSNLSVTNQPIQGEPTWPKLDEGEAAVIKLAKTIEADLLLMDDRKGVRVAREQGFAVTGTLGVLELAAERHGLDLRKAINLLGRTNFYCSKEVIDALLARSDGKS